MERPLKKEKSRVITKKESIAFENARDELRALEKMLNETQEAGGF